jgi:hypothetical protein
LNGDNKGKTRRTNDGWHRYTKMRQEWLNTGTTCAAQRYYLGPRRDNSAIVPFDFMNANEKLKMMTTTNEQSSPAGSMEDETTPATNESDNNFVTPESNAWETMLRWKEEILVDSLLSIKFDKMVSKLFEENEVKTVKDIKNEAAKDKWLNQLDDCGVKRGAFLEKLNKIQFTEADTRMVPVDYEITESDLSHNADLCALRKRVDATFGWYNTKPQVFLAPYFPFIQSSGMGKTKLLYHLRIALNELKNTACYLCLSGAIDISRDEWRPKNDKKVFDHELDFQNIVGRPDQTKEAAKKVMQYLDDRFLACSKKRLVLLFDEAQVLLTENFSIKAFLFQCIRLWLRVTQESRKFQCVAVFAGTTSNLANFFPDESLVTILSSRDVKEKSTVRTFLPSGERLPLPFYHTTTTGCCHILNMRKGPEAVANREGSEYDQAVPYGRPLFAKMAENNELENRLGKVLTRMLLSDVKQWDKNQESCLSLLGTRVQMGQTSTETASRLVSKGYANLVGFSDNHLAQICHHPDPVCARLAMAMMDEDWKMNVKDCVVSGKSKHWWVERAAASFSSGLCKPDKGDAGEVFAALYLLFCGDLIRKETAPGTFAEYETLYLPSEPTKESKQPDFASLESMEEPNQLDSAFLEQMKESKLPGIARLVKVPSYRHFSVPLDSWVANLISPSTEEKLRNKSRKEPTEPETSPSQSNPPLEAAQVATAPSVSFIQVYRNYLRQFKDYNFVASQSLLEHLYKSGTAFYTYPCCPAFDIIASIQYMHNNEFHYAPLLISVKARNSFYPCEAEANCCVMEDGLIKTGCFRALCIVMVMAATNVSEYGSRLLKKEDIEDLFAAGKKKMVMAKVLPVRNDDAFGISQTIIEATSDGQQMSEILASHHSIIPHANDSSYGPLTVSCAMRNPRKRSEYNEAAILLETLVKEFKVEKGTRGQVPLVEGLKMETRSRGQRTSVEEPKIEKRTREQRGDKRGDNHNHGKRTKRF